MTHAVGLCDEQDEPSIPALTDWLAKRDAFVSHGIEIKPSPAGGWGILATRDLDHDELICFLPKSAVLSIRTSSLRLPPELQLDAPDPGDRAGSIGTNRTIPTLALVLLHELRLGKESSFWGYLQSLPRSIGGLPIFWPEDGDARKWLRGTEAGRELAKKDELCMGYAGLKRFYEATKHLLPPTTAHDSPSPVEAFLHAYALVTTRAFLIDLYHTLALVPFADLLNHSTRNHTSLASDDFVCHICGSLATCAHDSDDIRLQHLDMRQRRKVEEEVDTVEMRVENLVEAGEEVMNTYGAGIGDSRLLVEWGFIEGEFAGNGLQWDIHEVLGGDTIAMEKVWREVIDRGAVALELFPDSDMVGLELEDDDESGLIAAPASSDPAMLDLNQNGRISLALWLAVSLRHLPPTKPGRLNTALISAYHHLDDLTDEASTTKPPLHVCSTIQTVVDIFTVRLGNLYRPEADIEELLDMRDALADDQRDLKMAMTITIDERTLLKSALSEWKEVLAKAKAAVA